jgi:tripartite-type tricarboxylate transporter receptor subunit TctC
MIDRFCQSLATALVAACLLSPYPAGAESYPARRITLVVPYTPGSGFDIVARVIGQQISERWGQPVVIDNKPGASGALGAESVANAPPDGYTLLVTGAPHTVSPSLSRNLRYDPVASFTALAGVGSSGLALTVNPTGLAVGTLDEFLANVRSRPWMVNYSSPGTGTLQHLGVELFKQQLGLNVVHVPYRGASVALTDLITGQVQFAFLPVHTGLPLARSGKLRMIAVASNKRSAFAPEVPSFAELGLANLEFELWYGLFGPAGLPAETVDRWETEIAAVIALPEVREILLRQGITPAFTDAAGMTAKVAKEIARWRKVADTAGIGPE